jgi:hypothetical protein
MAKENRTWGAERIRGELLKRSSVSGSRAVSCRVPLAQGGVTAQNLETRVVPTSGSGLLASRCLSLVESIGFDQFPNDGRADEVLTIVLPFVIITPVRQMDQCGIATFGREQLVENQDLPKTRYRK